MAVTKIKNSNIADDAIDARTVAAGEVGPSELASTAVTPASYTNSSITVDADGRITAASNGTAPVIAANVISNEVPSGTINGVNDTFTLANTPITGSQKVYRHGIRMTPTVDYTITGSTIVFVAGQIPTTGENLQVDYLK